MTRRKRSEYARDDGSTFVFTTTGGPWRCPCGGTVEADTISCSVLHTTPVCQAFVDVRTPRELRDLLTATKAS